MILGSCFQKVTSMTLRRVDQKNARCEVKIKDADSEDKEFYEM